MDCWFSLCVQGGCCWGRAECLASSAWSCQHHWWVSSSFAASIPADAERDCWSEQPHLRVSSANRPSLQAVRKSAVSLATWGTLDLSGFASLSHLMRSYIPLKSLNCVFMQCTSFLLKWLCGFRTSQNSFVTEYLYAVLVLLTESIPCFLGMCFVEFFAHFSPVLSCPRWCHYNILSG